MDQVHELRFFVNPIEGPPIPDTDAPGFGLDVDQFATTPCCAKTQMPSIPARKAAPRPLDSGNFNPVGGSDMTVARRSKATECPRTPVSTRPTSPHEGAQGPSGASGPRQVTSPPWLLAGSRTAPARFLDAARSSTPLPGSSSSASHRGAHGGALGLSGPGPCARARSSRCLSLDEDVLRGNGPCTVEWRCVGAAHQGGPSSQDTPI